jgi:hypothetical protein
MLKTIIRTTACLAVSAAAFIAVTKLDANAARSRSGSVPESSEAKPAPTKPTKPAPAPPAPKLTTASLVLPAKAAPSTAVSKTDATLTVPDWKGKRLSVVRREARKLGLHVAAVDDTGEAVSADMASEYRVRRMLTAAGTAVEPGADVQVRVREIVDAAAGY